MKMAANYGIAQLHEIDGIDDGREPFRPVRHHFGIQTFGIIASTASKAGGRVINEHDEAEPNSSEELYFVATGHARFELDGKSEDAPAGTFVHVPPGIKRTAFAEEDGTTVLAIGAAPPGQPYTVENWEMFAPLFPLFASGDYEEGADRANEILATEPPSGSLYYNTACFESRAGRIEDALAHLKRGVELSPHLAELARSDDDFAAIRENPAFAEIVGG
jgi:tetratricopeptide (TPR) repeat protein